MYYLILAVLTIIVVVVSAKSAMLRNQIFNEANFLALAASMGIKHPKSAFSLGRSQLAFWMVIIIGSFVYVYLNANPQTYMAPALATVNLTLLGITAGTTILSKAIDNSQRESTTDTVPQQDYPSKGFLIDIISDENGVSIHRLQNVIWTVIVGAIYIAYVSAKSLMPDDTVITQQLLILMGISTGAYLGLKTTENKAAGSTIPPVDSVSPTDPVAPNNNGNPPQN